MKRINTTAARLPCGGDRAKVAKLFSRGTDDAI
jgi:hypothetical protein